MDLVSVVVPVYNVEKYLRRCVDSILAQTYTNLEIILIDDGSSDSCPAICDEYAEKDDRIKVIHKENGGVSSARNAGLRIFSGDYLTFIDSDDFVGEKYIENLVKNTADGVGIVISSYKSVSSELKPIETALEIDKDTAVQINDKFDFTQKTINHKICCKLFSKYILTNLFFCEDIFFGEDTLFCAKAFQNSQTVKYITDCSYNYVVYDESLSHGKMTAKKATLLAAWEETVNTFPEKSLSHKTCAGFYLSTCFCFYRRALLSQGPNDDVVKYFYSLIKSDKTHSIYKIAPKTLKLRLKYNLLIHFRKIYDTLLLLKEPIVKHYRND